MQPTTNQPKGTTMNNLTIKSRRNAYSIVGKEVTATSARSAAEQAGIDWTVSLADLQALALNDSGVSTLDVPNKFATIRTNKDGGQSVLGTVGGRYKVLQNGEMFSALDALVDSGDARYAYAGEIKGGAQVYMVLELPKDVKIGNDPHKAYLVARTSHDGSCALQIAPSVNRLRCTNQIAGIFNKSATYTLKHTTNADFSIEDIKRIIPVTYTGIEQYELIGNKLIGETVSDQEVDTIFKKMWSLPSGIEQAPYNMLSTGEKGRYNRAMTARSTAKAIYRGDTGTQEELYGTAFGAFQAIVEYVDHYSHAKEATRAERNLTGMADKAKTQALSLVMKG
jgi:phage/plasmid-like protein (TIGR03299 family)